MKKHLALVALLALGCSGEAAESEDPTSHIGRSQESIVYWDAYGSDGAMNRCWYDNGNAGWAGGFCRMPNGVSWTVVIPDANKTQGCDPDTRVGASNAAVDFRDYMNARGWNIKLLTANEVKTPFAFDAHVASVSCDSPSNHPELGPNIYGTSVLPSKARCPAASLFGIKCLDAGRRGTIVSYDATKGPFMLEANWKAASFWVGKTATQKRQFTRNIILHELFHFAGLGHDTFDETPLMGLGENVEFAFDHVIWPTDFESAMLDCVNPNRDGLFELCTL